MQWDGNEISLLKMIPHARLSDVLVVRRYSAGAYVFEQNDSTTGLWFVLYGNVAVERIEMDGNLTTTGVWMVGDIVGIAGLWDQSGYPASARALTTPTVMGWILRDTVMRLHVEVPAFGLEVSRLLAERLRFVQESVSGRQGRPIIMQVASVVWTLSRRMGTTINLTHEDLSHIIGTHRETVSRAIQELTREGILSSRHGAIHIVDSDKLANWSLIMSKPND